MARTRGVRCGRAIAVGSVAIATALLAVLVGQGGTARPDAQSLRLSILRAALDPDATARASAPSVAEPRHTLTRVTRPTRALLAAGGFATFGQPTMSGVNGFGFEADL